MKVGLDMSQPPVPVSEGTRIYFCTPHPYDIGHFKSRSVLLGLIHSLEVRPPEVRYGRVKMVRKVVPTRAGQDSILYPATKFFAALRKDFQIPERDPFNLYYQTPTEGWYLERCDDSTAEVSRLLDMTGEYEIFKFSIGGCKRVWTLGDVTSP